MPPARTINLHGEKWMYPSQSPSQKCCLGPGWEFLPEPGGVYGVGALDDIVSGAANSVPTAPPVQA